MIQIEAKRLQQLAPLVSRVLVLDPHSASAELTSTLLKQLGARQRLVLPRTTLALDAARQLQPQLVICDYLAPQFDGPLFVRQLRRLPGELRKTPVIMISGVATVESIKAARDSGVHEFLRKPYTAGDFLRRVENVMFKPRLWIDAQMYVGPDRRRFNSGEFAGDDRRNAMNEDETDGYGVTGVAMAG